MTRAGLSTPPWIQCKLVRRNCKTSAELSQCELGGLAAPVFRFVRGSNRRVNAARQLDVIFFLEELSNSILYDTPALHPPALPVMGSAAREPVETSRSVRCVPP